MSTWVFFVAVMVGAILVSVVGFAVRSKLLTYSALAVSLMGSLALVFALPPSIRAASGAVWVLPLAPLALAVAAIRSFRLLAADDAKATEARLPDR